MNSFDRVVLILSKTDAYPKSWSQSKDSPLTSVLKEILEADFDALRQISLDQEQKDQVWGLIVSRVRQIGSASGYDANTEGRRASIANIHAWSARWRQDHFASSNPTLEDWSMAVDGRMWDLVGVLASSADPGYLVNCFSNPGWLRVFQNLMEATSTVPVPHLHDLRWQLVDGIDFSALKVGHPHPLCCHLGQDEYLRALQKGFDEEIMLSWVKHLPVTSVPRLGRALRAYWAQTKTEHEIGQLLSKWTAHDSRSLEAFTSEPPVVLRSNLEQNPFEGWTTHECWLWGELARGSSCDFTSFCRGPHALQQSLLRPSPETLFLAAAHGLTHLRFGGKVSFSTPAGEQWEAVWNVLKRISGSAHSDQVIAQYARHVTQSSLWHHHTEEQKEYLGNVLRHHVQTIQTNAQRHPQTQVMQLSRMERKMIGAYVSWTFKRVKEGAYLSSSDAQQLHTILTDKVCSNLSGILDSLCHSVRAGVLSLSSEQLDVVGTICGTVHQKKVLELSVADIPSASAPRRRL